MSNKTASDVEKNMVPYGPVIENIEDWPIYRLSKDRDKFIDELIDFSANKINQKPVEVVTDWIASTVYKERIRIKEEPWKVDPPNDSSFWKTIRKKLLNGSLDKPDEEARLNNQEILKSIVERYSEEIVGTFNIKTFLFARKFLTVFFNRLLNTAKGRNLGRIYGSKQRLEKSLKVTGQLDMVRSLMTKGTVVLAPTHFSNLDSILIGYAMDAMLGLPSFSYGAGLNLYNTGYTAYFMNRLGAYRVDRRKKNPIYLEVLKSTSKLSIERGTNSLFFPGGTRGRSGALEKKLKLGLLGTTIEAQRSHCENDKNEKIFIVPLILSYHFVLEAKFLIEEHLKRTGKEQFIQPPDASYSRRKILKFIWELFSESSDITLSFGKPMDVLGNFVDEKGTSFDERNNELNIKDYFISDGQVKRDAQREAEYTKILADRIVESFHRENVVLSSHLLAFTVFNIFKSQNKKLDIFGLLRLPPEDYTFPFKLVKNTVEKLKGILMEMEARGQIRLSPEIKLETTELVKNGVANLGAYHALKPLSFNKFDNIVSQDFKTLYYYHNRLTNYGLRQKVNWEIGELVLEEI